MKNIPAFPVFPETGSGHASAFQGMTLRDYFAAKAMQGMCANPESDATKPLYVFAKAAYQVADEMMKAREA